MTVQVETARHQWEDGYRRFQAAARERDRFDRLAAQVEALTEELRRRLGQIFTLRELADEYANAERWSRDIRASAVPPPGPADLSTAEDAAFHLYARGARDYVP